MALKHQQRRSRAGIPELDDLVVPYRRKQFTTREKTTTYTNPQWPFSVCRTANREHLHWKHLHQKYLRRKHLHPKHVDNQSLQHCSQGGSSFLIPLRNLLLSNLENDSDIHLCLQQPIHLQLTLRL